jgi:hypothetical protein
MKAKFLMLGLVALLGAGAGCSGGDKVTAPANGTVIFKIDAQTCTGAGTITFYIDGSAVGTETLAAGGSSKGYTTPAGTHVLGATEAGVGAYTWPSQTAAVPAGGTYTAVLTC